MFVLLILVELLTVTFFNNYQELMFNIQYIYSVLHHLDDITDVTTTLRPRDSSTTTTNIIHQHMTNESNTSTIGKNIFIFHM
jgi:hypothetical protein